MTANYSNSHIGYLNKLVGEHNNSYQSSTGKKHIHAKYSALTEETEANFKAPKFKASDSVIITKLLSIRIFLAKITIKNGQKKYLGLILCGKLILGHIKLKI